MDPLFVPEPSNRVRVILNTDAKNEADDQYAIVHAILTPLFELHGIIPAHFGDRRGPGSLQASHEEVLKLLDLMDLNGRIPVHSGAATMLPDEKTPVPSEGSALIIEEALKDDPRPLHIAFLGPLTDMASALLEKPSIADRNVRVIWIGGQDWPVGGWEYNLWNDVTAANVYFAQRSNCGRSQARSIKEWQSAMPNLLEKSMIRGLWASTWWNNLSRGTISIPTEGI